MKIKKVKKIKDLKRNDVVLLSIADQQDAGVYSDITEPNVIAIVSKITFNKNTVTILTNGGYEFTYPNKCVIFCLGNQENLQREASILTQMFDDNDVPVKEINKYIKAVREEQKTQKFVKESLN